MPKAETPKKKRSTSVKRDRSAATKGAGAGGKALSLGEILDTCFSDVPEEAWEKQPHFSNKEMDRLA